ncbi:CPBP family intramembrane metalloprotease [Massilia arenosa]|uniref:CPBP family intramembrane metalloprotease n=1 Tax=Zemynaea arenosa TaxID=2561931 RepID=A0A4Y9S0M7_9BURK|nr:CPBP family intramembrane glutamic endopeptidase [Massilia arenosa]TFW13586.1 CPBP family intramembrane metalloprotease [Massilia arenosa]
MHLTSNGAIPRPTAARLLLVAVVLFFFYQLPHGVGNDNLILMVPLVAWWGSRMLGFHGLRAWYLDARQGWLRLLGLGVVLSCAAKALALVIGSGADVYTVAWTGGPPLAALAGPLALTVFGTFVASISEDILTRGLVLRAFPRLDGRWLFIVVSSALYVLNHIYRLQKGPSEWIMLFCMGLAYAAALYRSGTLWAAVGLHWGWNLANGLADLFGQVDVANATAAPYWTAGAHLVMLAVTLLVMRPNSLPAAAVPSRAPGA